MGQRCCVCGFETIFFIWTSTRGFPIDLLNKVLENPDKSAKPICFKCYNKLKDNE